MGEKSIKVGISQGDINGISYELILKTFEDPRIFELCTPILYGSSKVLAYHRKTMELPSVNISSINRASDAGPNRLNIIISGNEEVNVELSKPTKEADEAAKKALNRALDDLAKGYIDVLVTAPSNIDEQTYIQEKIAENKNQLTVLVDNDFRIALATDKQPFSEVLPLLSTEFIVDKIKSLHRVLVQDFMITMPRIAVLSFNPGVGMKEQKFGKEESEIIIPAIKSVCDSGMICFGPYAADDFFQSDKYKTFDAVLAIYNDQGRIPFSALTEECGVEYTANLPKIITSADMKVSYDKAGKNIVTESGFRNAIYLALDIFRNRIIDKEINANPLKKLYFEKGSDNEKLDLTAEHNDD